MVRFFACFGGRRKRDDGSERLHYICKEWDKVSKSLEKVADNYRIFSNKVIEWSMEQQCVPIQNASRDMDELISIFIEAQRSLLPQIANSLQDMTKISQLPKETRPSERLLRHISRKEARLDQERKEAMKNGNCEELEKLDRAIAAVRSDRLDLLRTLRSIERENELLKAHIFKTVMNKLAKPLATLGKCFEMVMEGQQDILKLLPDIENESRYRKSVTFTTGHSVVEGVRYCVQRALNKLSERTQTVSSANRSTLPPPPPYRP
ncbi:hypothetical protein T4B_5012 [Trichinella pseudospiralis]|uniref:Uncharacterized protein n=2 Tax=Trichinella pseudospiralis TaxID=6337 RepID=A0A0V1JK68_TRIPS|nr:hypothetical protein T4E_417 [Trichinella pseudospiralis]KRY75641.1 hypothetical protein T4A_11928 [Trichinella pseudospiralis]KRY86896.1 hypothetical protein T4D_8091 [Trichinella pseudospiralis]KRZ28535.1 hypothetical protein T4B_5012 [Trichinella pseudospiralis]KRZ35322.1 hypothetical protein T4C_1224 [Trichinella pseudospiralis]